MQTRRVQDMMGRLLTVPEVPLRIVSLVPSQTELLAYLGLEVRVVGITRFCEHPRKWFLEKPRVGGTKDADFERIVALNPDLIIANKEENTPEIVAQLSERFPVWVSDVRNLEQALEMIRQVGSLVGSPDKGAALADEIASAFQKVTRVSKITKVVYAIWKGPWMGVSGDTFIGDMLCRLGLSNIFETHESRYPQFEWHSLEEKPDIVLLSSEPYPFAEKHIREVRSALGEAAEILLVDGALFSWYGSRLMHAPEYFNELVQTNLKKPTFTAQAPGALTQQRIEAGGQNFKRNDI
jgi:ABC-type Fe3+-hydroxamate transport system substrate-binding protein